MTGAILGDIVGSRFERGGAKNYHFDFMHPGCRFTDDTVLTIAVADSIISGKTYLESIKNYAQRYPDAGYGGTFIQWMQQEDSLPYNSWGNGSAMRVSPVGFAFDDVDTVLAEAKKSAEVTHNHPEGIKGAQSVALAILLARKKSSKAEIASKIEELFGYDLSQNLDEIRPGYSFDVSCQGSVPQSVVCFLESTDVESAIRNAISLGDDTDTMACIAGGIAQAFYRRIEVDHLKFLMNKIPEEFASILSGFYKKYQNE